VAIKCDGIKKKPNKNTLLVHFKDPFSFVFLL
jgi:hypothetical protein